MVASVSRPAALTNLGPVVGFHQPQPGGDPLMADGDELPVGGAVGVRRHRRCDCPDFACVGFVIGSQGLDRVDDRCGVPLVKEKSDRVPERVVVDVGQDPARRLL